MFKKRDPKSHYYYKGKLSSGVPLWSLSYKLIGSDEAMPDTSISFTHPVTGHTERLKEILKKYDGPDLSDPAVMRKFIQNGSFEVNFQFSTTTSRNEFIPLSEAVLAENFAVAKVLIEHVANINRTSTSYVDYTSKKYNEMTPMDLIDKIYASKGKDIRPELIDFQAYLFKVGGIRLMPQKREKVSISNSAAHCDIMENLAKFEENPLLLQDVLAKENSLEVIKKFIKTTEDFETIYLSLDCKKQELLFEIMEPYFCEMTKNNCDDYINLLACLKIKKFTQFFNIVQPNVVNLSRNPDVYAALLYYTQYDRNLFYNLIETIGSSTMFTNTKDDRSYKIFASVLSNSYDNANLHKLASYLSKEQADKLIGYGDKKSVRKVTSSSSSLFFDKNPTNEPENASTSTCGMKGSALSN